MTEPPEMKELDAVTAELREIEKRREPLRDRAAELVVAALRKDMPPSEVAARSPFSAAHVRTLAREAGIPPAPPGIKPRKRTSREDSTSTSD
jgi:hypothetical protein